MMMIFIPIGLLIFYIYFYQGDFNFSSLKTNAKETLNQRLARGEINIDEYNKIKETLGRE
ncbi:MAG: hypothetical protein QM489_06265 [Candidatus Izemoplasma sp.]